MITLTPLTGPPSGSSSAPLADQPVSYLLQVDDVKVLLDLGGYDPRSCSERSFEYEERIRELAPEISLVLLSHSPSIYLSLYPYARAHWGLKCPVYATQPTLEMGRVVCLEEAQDWRAEVKVDDLESSENTQHGGQAMESIKEDGKTEEAEQEEQKPEKGKTSLLPLKGPFICTIDEINEAFNWVKSVRYSQPIVLSGVLSHLLLTPYSSGHTLGGTIFKLRSPTSGTILYAVGMNHTQERHLDGTVILNPGGMQEGLQRPDLLIVEGGRSLIKGVKQKDKAQALLNLITSTLTSNKSLLFPVDASPRLLELLVLLDQHWSYSISRENETRQRWNYPLCLVSRTAEEMLVFARSLMEWMGGAIAKAQEDVMNADNKRRGFRQKEVRSPLSFRHLKFYPTHDAFLRAFPENSPKLVLAVPLSMSYGPSRRLFTKMAVEESATIVLTGRSEDHTLSNEMFRMWNRMQTPPDQYGAGGVGTPKSASGNISVIIDSKVALEGNELEAHLEAERVAKEKEMAHKAAQERSRRMLEADDLEDSDSDEEDEDEADVDGTEAALDKIGTDALERLEGKGGQISTTGIPAAGNAFMETDDFRTASFDIYVKGQQMRTTSFFGGGRAGPSAGQTRFRMFPFVERKMRKVDVYGETLDVGAWIRKGREIEEEVESPEVREAKRRKKEEEEKQKKPPEPPSKYISEEISVNLKCSIFYVDMEGLHDGRAIKTIIPSLNPRRVIVVRSLPAASQDLLTSCAGVTALTKEIYVPEFNETISIGEQTQSHSISLSEGLLSSLSGQWARFEDYEIARIAGRITSGVTSAIPVLDLPYKAYQMETGDGGESKEDPNADPDEAYLQNAIEGEEGDDFKPILPTSATSAHAPKQTSLLFSDVTSHLVQNDPRPVLPQSLYIGDLRLTALKSTLNTSGIPVEFAGEGTLICGPGVPDLVKKYQEASEKGLPMDGLSEQEDIGEIVVVQKSADGKLQLEGGLSSGETYYTVRKVLYGSFAEVIV
ncbi:hypothetical protein NliqN6_3061 [Naganishia liquefaciens]|uniref:Cleavage and polyadenylation specificity factor subunit 2 n=1 Tax=Naganishia liquefaciens TaxID=104408 RepID=A0A8H3TV11_9TREE|nr:hypothetical protein NliqN6_3061 [Naganishia liquefaciens]